MRGVPHLLIGASCGLALLGYNPGHPELVALAAAGALLPDWDHPGSTISRVPVIGPIGHIAIAGATRVVNLLRPIENPFTDEDLVHRGPFHTPLLAIVLYALARLAGLDALMALALLVGYLSHLVGDEFTHMGIAWLWPVYNRTLRLPVTWDSGSAIELPVSFAVLVIALHFAGVPVVSMISEVANLLR